MRTLERTYDVVVVGGGLSGFAAAMKCAANGLETIIVERRPALGWEGTWAFCLDATEATSDVGRRVLQSVEAAGGRRGHRIDAPILEMTLDQLAREAGVAVLYYSVPLGIHLADDLAHCTMFGWKNGEFSLRAKAYVDATENGFLWRDAGLNLAPPETLGASHALFLNGTQWSGDKPAIIGECNGAGGVVIKPSVWDGEAAVEFEVDRCDVRAARLLLPEVLRGVREQMPELAPANCTHVAYEPMPTEHWVSPEESDGACPACANLFAAGLWTSDAQQPNTLANRLEVGERAGEAVAQRIGDLPEAHQSADTAQSLSAPPQHECEVVVCGGGTGGALAGIAAAREGADTTLIEPATFLGGIGSGGGIHMYYHGVAGGIQDELDKRVAELTPLFVGEGSAQGFHPEAKKVVLEQMADEAGVHLVYDTTVTGVRMEDIASDLPATGEETPPRRITGVITAGPEGGALYKADVVIDSTGDADVAATAGAPYTYGREKDELTHAYSQPSGALGENAMLRIVNFDAGYCDPSDVEDLTRARRHGLSHYFQDKHTPGDRRLYIAPLLGLRNSRQIIGDYVLTLADEIEGREFPDVIAYAYSHFDNHGYDYENESDEAAVWVWLLGNWRRQFGCEIPYRCLLPHNVDGMLIACRALSMTHDAHNQLRMQRDMQRVGQAAGVAAAMAVKAGVTPREIDIAQLQQRLFELGDLGPRRQPELPPPDTDDLVLHDNDWKPEALPMKPVDELVAQLGGEDPRGAVWQLARSGQEAVPALLSATKDDSPQTRLWSSLALGIAGREEAVPELVRALESREDDASEALKVAPVWQSAMILLGRIGSADAVPALVGVLSDKESSLDVLIAAVRALGRIGDASAAGAIDEMLARDDLPLIRPLQVSTKGSAVTEDCRWQLELAAVETLGRLGAERPELVEKHLDDDRAYVRRYARKVLHEFDREG